MWIAQSGSGLTDLAVSSPCCGLGPSRLPPAPSSPALGTSRDGNPTAPVAGPHRPQSAGFLPSAYPGRPLLWFKPTAPLLAPCP